MPVVGPPGSNPNFNPFRRAAIAAGRAPRKPEFYEAGPEDGTYMDRFAEPAFDYAALVPLVEAYKREQEFKVREGLIKQKASEFKGTWGLDKKKFNRAAGFKLAREMKARDEYIAERAPKSKKLIDEYRRRDAEMKNAGFSNQAFSDMKLGDYGRAATQLSSQNRLAYQELFGSAEDKARIDQAQADLLAGRGTFDSNLAVAKGENAVAAARRQTAENQGGSWWATGLEWMGAPLEQAAMRPYYAGQLGSRTEGGFWTGINTAVQNAPGLSWYRDMNPDSLAAKAGRATDSREERDDLTQRGLLQSFGQLAAQKPGANIIAGSLGGGLGLLGAANINEQLAQGSKDPQLLGRSISGGYDAFFNIAGDPLTYTPLILAKAGRVGQLSGWLSKSSVAREVAVEGGAGIIRRTGARVAPTAFLGRTAPELIPGAVQAGRESFLAGRVGGSLLAGSDKALANASDASSLAKMLNVPMDIAEQAIKARNAGGLTRGSEILRAAFVSSDFSPVVTLRRQALAQLGLRGAVGGRGIPVVLGNKAFRANEGLTRKGLSFIARDNGSRLLLNKTGRATDGIVERAPLFITNRKVANVADFWQTSVKPVVENLSDEDRVARLITPEMSASFRAEVDNTVRLMADMSPDRAADELRRLEFVNEILLGKGGKTAQRMARVELAAKAPVVDSWNAIVKSAARDQGLDRSEEMAPRIQEGLAQLPLWKQYEATLKERKRGLEAQLVAAGPDAKPAIQREIEVVQAELDPVSRRIREVNKEVAESRRLSNMFHKPTPETVPKNGLGKPRPAKKVYGEIAELEKELIPARREELRTALTELKREEKLRVRSELDAIDKAIKVNVGTQDTLRPRLNATTDTGLGLRRGNARTVKANRNVALEGRVKELATELRALREQKRLLARELVDIDRGVKVTAEMADLATELRVLSAAVDDTPAIQRATNAVHSAEVALGTIDRSIDVITKLTDDGLKALDVSEDDWLKAGYNRYLSRVDDELKKTRKGLKARVRALPKHSPTFDAKRALEEMDATERRVVGRLVQGVPEKDADALYVRLAELKLLREDAVAALADERKVLDGLVAEADIPTGAPVLRPVPLQDWEMKALIERTGLDEAAIRQAERLTDKELSDKLEWATQQMERYSNTSITADLPEYEAYGRGDLAAQGIAKDMLSASQDVVLYSEMLSRTANRTHPLLDRLSAVRAEADNLIKQTSAKGSADISDRLDAMLEKALRTVGVADGSPLKNTAANRSFLRVRIGIIGDPKLRDLALEELARLEQKNVKSLSAFGAQVETVLRNEGVRDRSVELLDIAQGAAAGRTATAGLAKTGGFRRTIGQVANLPLSILEPVPPTHIRWSSASNDLVNARNLGEDIDRWASAVGFDINTISQMKTVALGTRTEDELITLLRDAYIVFAEKAGVPPSVLLDPGSAAFIPGKTNVTGLGDVVTKTTRRGKEKLLDAEELTDVQLITQRINNIPVLSPEEMRKLVREWKAANGTTLEMAGAKARLGLGRIPGANLPLTGGKLSVGEVAKKTHRFWKFTVVTNAQTAAVGAVGGFFTADGELDDRLRKAGLYGAIGLLGSVRYLGRVVGVEERLIRYTMVRGLNPIEFIPGIAKYARRVGVSLPFTQGDELASGANPLHHYEGKKLVTVGDEWVTLGQTDSRFIDGWYRIANFQIHPETDDIARMTLQGKLGIIGSPGTDEWKVLAKEWLTDTSDGKLFYRRMSAASGGPKNLDELLARYERAIDTYLPSDDLKRLRLANADNPDAALGHKDLRSFLKEGDAPAAVYAEDSWYVPSPLSLKRWQKTWRTVYGRSVLESPTAKVNRIPLAEAIYGDEFRRLVANGMDPQRARMVAEDRAVEMTNRVMFRISDESRFAAKADFVFPFQQPREELLRVYTRLIVDNKGRVAQWGANAARLFNNGVESGAFFEDQYGNWRMRVPGSAYLSRVFGAPGNAEFDFALKDAFFFLQGGAGSFGGDAGEAEMATGLLTGTLPIPGGPFWTTAVNLTLNAHPWIEKQYSDTWAWKKLFPFGAQGFISRPEARRMWYAMTSSAAPWEFLAQKEDGTSESENEFHKVQSWVINQLRWDHRDDPNYYPSLEEVQSSTSTLFTLWAALGSVVPAPTRPTLQGRADFDKLVEEYKERYGYGLGEGEGSESWVKAMYRDHPQEMAIYFTSQTKRLDPGSVDDFDEWIAEGNGIKPEQYNMQYKRYLSYDEYRHVWNDQRRLSKAWAEYNMVLNGVYMSPAERQFEIQSFLRRQKEENPDVNFNASYFKKKELARILQQVPESQRNQALMMWRQTYDVSGSEFMRLKYEVQDFDTQPWIEARSEQEILDAVNKAKYRGINELQYVENQLSPAEQVMYWNHKITELGYYDTRPYQSDPGFGGKGQTETGYPGDLVKMRNDYQSRVGLLFKNNPSLSGKSKKQTAYAEFISKRKGEYYAALDENMQEIFRLADAKDIAYKAKDWTTYNALKVRLNDANERQRALKNEVFKKYPDWASVASDIKALVVISKNQWANPELAREQLEKWKRKVGKNPDINPYFVTFGDDGDYLQMTADQRRAYVDDLTIRLDMGKGNYEEEDAPIRWMYLTQFQKELLEKNFPAKRIEAWKEEDRVWDVKEPKTYSRNYRPYYRRSRRGYGGGDEASISLDYAFNLMKQYNKRPEGAQAPAAYQEYLALPQDPGVKRQFLRAHPEVAEWIRLGPLSNMPVLDRAIVTNIMVKYGKWEGEPKDSNEITEVAWARLQMEMWSKRGDSVAPETYYLWLDMPTGVDKAQYLKDHPEIKDWLALGPMTNMPDNLKDIVRDIMLRYGEWTAAADPLGETMSEFYRLPSYARQKYLQDHPELTEYWAALRSPEEERIHKLSEAYFAITDPMGRKMFLSAHPELQEDFVKSRQRRYEKFLNQVAQFMGSNPEMFEQYLTRQTDIMTELLRRFGEMPMVREQPRVTSKVAKGKRAATRQAS